MAMDGEAGRQAGRRLLRADGKPLYYRTYLMYLTYRLPLVPVAWWGATVAIPTPTL